MLDPRANSILYQSQEYLVTLVDSLITDKRRGKALNECWDKADRIIHYFEAYNERLKLEDPDQINYVLECLVSLAELYQYPSAPTFTMATPPAIVAVKGDKGDPGDDGAQGPIGYATDIQTILSSTSIVDQFSVASAKGVRWDYIVTESAGNQRAGSIVATWSPDGVGVDFNDISTGDIIGSTAALEFTVQYNAGNIELIANITSGVWSIVATRYFIPNNGNGSGPISNVLPNGLIYIGNVLNVAEARLPTGVISITNIGVTSFNPGVIFNSDINIGAAIAVNKLAALDPSRIVVTDPLGYITTVLSPTLTELGHLGGASSNLQVQINGKMTDPMTSIGDMVIRDGANQTTRLGIGATNEVLTVIGGVPTWQPAQGTLPQISIDIGDWDMFTNGSKTVTIPGLAASKIRAVSGIVRTDIGSVLGETYYPVASYGSTNSTGAMPIVSFGVIAPSGGDSLVQLFRTDGELFQSSPNFGDTGYNRGWIVVTYVP